jgi:hypothetical protein
VSLRYPFRRARNLLQRPDLTPEVTPSVTATAAPGVPEGVEPRHA